MAHLSGHDRDGARDERISEQVKESLVREEITNERLITRGRLIVYGVNLALLAVISLLITRWDTPTVLNISVFAALSLTLFFLVLFLDRFFTHGRYHPSLKYILTTLDLLFITTAIVINRNASGAATYVMSTDAAPFYGLFLINALSGLRLDIKHSHYCAAGSVLIFAAFTALDLSRMTAGDPVPIVSAVMKGVLLVGTAYASGIIGIRARKLVIENLKEQQGRNLIAAVLGRYLPGPAAEKILSGDVELSGEERTITVLFSDIRDFTGISERLSPYEVVGLLNRYLEHMVRIVFTHDGTLDKFLGDGFMAIFGAPFPHGDDPRRAIRAALDMRRALEEFNRSLIDRYRIVSLGMGIGIATGRAVVGTIGSAERMEYTAIGDTVNTASRIMDAGRKLRTDIVVDGATYRAVEGFVSAQKVSPTKLKGKDTPVDLYKIIEMKDIPSLS
ncbi:MAG: adenylate/guanylate cyclase domain-containing protein [Deltaproteobacteria bacterium]|nr:adenylate/guanylate cyclase domain-containing protein [Candidatus Zymogenaceae bacterium]